VVRKSADKAEDKGWVVEGTRNEVGVNKNAKGVTATTVHSSSQIQNCQLTHTGLHITELSTNPQSLIVVIGFNYKKI